MPKVASAPPIKRITSTTRMILMTGLVPWRTGRGEAGGNDETGGAQGTTGDGGTGVEARGTLACATLAPQAPQNAAVSINGLPQLPQNFAIVLPSPIRILARVSACKPTAKKSRIIRFR